MRNSSDYWWNRPDVWAGAALAGYAGVESFKPSLMPRATMHQALLTGASGTAGWAIGSSTYFIAARTGHAGADTALLSSVAAAGLSARYLIPWSDNEPRWRAPVRSAAQLVGAGAASAATITAIRKSKSRSVAGVLTGVGTAALGVLSVRKSMKEQKADRDVLDVDAPNPAKAIVQGVGILGVLGALIGGYQQSGGALSRIMVRRLGVPPTMARYTGDVLAAGIWVLGVRAAYGTAIGGLARYDRVVDPGFDRPPETPNRSGSPDSHIPWSRLGRQGRRFITNTPTPADIEAVMGEAAIAEPVRVFVGYDSARTAADRVALAMAELRRTSALDRSLLIVSAPAGTGYVNTLPMEVADFALLGDCASVSVQYARLPSLLALQQTPSGANHHRLLLKAIMEELEARPEDARPRVVVYGESLGSWAGQDAFIGSAIESLDNLGVDKALWVGTPYYSKWRQEALASGGAPAGTVEQINSVDELESSPQARRVTLLTHYNDPIDRINAEMFLREPDWLTETPRKPGISSNQKWMPVLTALQSIIDAVNATNPTPGVFRATGHDYRLDLLRVTTQAFDLPEPSESQWATMMNRLQADEAARASAMKLSEQPLIESGAVEAQ
ncbi:MAG: alpha/beta-hydrolase family protein [Acidimicrobiia bacterium]